MKKRIKYQHLFEKMANDLESLIEDGHLNITPTPPEQIIACPLCLRFYTLEALDYKLLVPEHVPAKSMGGKVKTLTCADCNHRHGSRFEGSLVKRLQYEEFGRLVIGSSAESTFVYDGNNVNTQITFLGEKEFRFNFDTTKSHPKHGDVVQDILRQENISDISFIPKKKFDERDSDMGVLRTAYLKMFVEFGYKYLLHPNLEIIRKQFITPQKSLLQNFGLVDKNVPETLPQIGIVIDPTHLQSYFVCVELKSKLGEKFRFGVLLPLRIKDGLRFYDFLAEHNSSGNWPKLIIQPI